MFSTSGVDDIPYPRQLLDEYFQVRNAVARANDMHAVAVLADEVLFASFVGEHGIALAVVYHPEGARGLAKVVGAPEPEHEVPALAWSVTPLCRCRLDARALAKIARGLRYGAQLVVVGGSARDFWIDGIARRNQRTDGGEVLRFAAPRAGTLVIEYGHFEALRYEAGKRVLPALNVLGMDGPVRNAIGQITSDHGSGNDFYSCTEVALARILREVRATRAGAILALCARPPDSSTLDAIPYRWLDTDHLSRCIADEKRKRSAHLRSKRMPRHTPRELDRALRGPEAGRLEAECAENNLTDAICEIAQMSAIEGALLSGPNLALYGAGYTIPRGAGITPRTRRALDVRADTCQEFRLRARNRHSAAFAYAWHNKESVVFVVSRDGTISCSLRIGDDIVVWAVRIPET